MSSGSGPVTLVAETVVTPGRALTPGWVTLEGGHVINVGAGTPPRGGCLVDLGNRVLCPGFIDVHVHGADGAQVNGDSADDVAESVRRIAAYHARHGTTAMLATTVSGSTAGLVECLRGIGQVTREGPSAGARVLGAHLEGPWLAADRAGAQDPRQLRAPSPVELELLLSADPGVLRMVTLAPELPGALEVVRHLAEVGVVAAVGHTSADLETARSAVDAGARHVTHLFNAMPGIHHRNPGPVVLGLTDERLTVEVIADGKHLDAAVLRLVMRLAAGRVVAVTDSTAPTGLPPGRYRLGSLDVEVGQDRAALADAPQTLAGSVLTMDLAVANLVSAGTSLVDAVTAATLTPARAIGDPARGRLEVGAVADVVVLSQDLACLATMVDGRAVFDPERLLGAGLA